MAAAADHPPLDDVPTRWPVVSSEYLHRDGWVVALRADQVTAPDADVDDPGTPTFRRLVVEHPGAAVVLALDEHRRVRCLWQYRHATARRFVELPAGLLDGDADEPPLEVARRELREEAQLQAATWTHLSSVHPSPGITAEVQHLYLATDLAPADRGDFELRHEEAEMDAAWVPFDELHDAVVAGRLTDSPVALSVLLARARGLA